MTGPEQVRATLLAVARTGPALGRLPADASEAEALRHIAELVDRTVLPRRIRITLSGNADLSLDARNRRLLRYALDGRDGPRGRVAGGLAPEDRASVQADLAALLAGRRVVGIRILDVSPMADPRSPGLAAAALLRDAPPPPPDLDTMLAAALAPFTREILAACVVAADEILAIAGGDDALFALSDWAMAVFPDGEAGREVAPRPRLPDLEIGAACCIGWPAPGPGDLVVMRGRDRLGMALVEAGAGLDLLADLRTRLARPART